MDKSKLQRILDGLSNKNSGLGNAFKTVEEEMKRVANKLREEAEIKTVEQAQKRFKEIKELISNLVDTLENLKNGLSNNEQRFNSDFNAKIVTLKNALFEFKADGSDKFERLAEEIGNLRAEIESISNKKIEIPDFGKDIQRLESELERIVANLKENTNKETQKQSEEFKKQINNLAEDLGKIRTRTNFAGGYGGNANRDIIVGGNSSTLSRYTDINFIAGSLVTLNYANNDTTKRVDVTLSASGGSRIENEIPSMISGTQFAVDNIPSVGTVKFYEGNRRLTPSTDFSVSGSVITLTYTPPTESDKLVDYAY